MVSIIEKTGLQFIRGEFEYSRDDLREFRLHYEEFLSSITFLEHVKPLKSFNNHERPEGKGSNYFVTSELVKNGVILNGTLNTLSDDARESLSQLENRQVLSSVSTQDVRDISLNEKVLTSKFSQNWIPLPFIKVSNEGDASGLMKTIQARVWMEFFEERVEFVIVVNSDDFEADERNQHFAIGSAPEVLDDFLDANWSNYIQGLFVKLGNDDLDDDSEHLLNELGGAWDANYRLFVDWLSQSAGFSLKLSSAVNQTIPVCAYIDVGNDTTSVLLSESSNGVSTKGDEFAKFKQLELFDFGKPLSLFQGPFSTSAVFREGKMLRSEVQHLGLMDKMRWLSPVALGKEASRLMSSESIDNAADARPIGLSSPKRFLWDTALAEREWVFASGTDSHSVQPISMEGITDRMSSDGTYYSRKQIEENRVPRDAELNVERTYSRQSISSFVFLEICCQIHRQINSPEFRKFHGEESTIRLLDRIVISCPTGMSKIEQVALRKACETAVQMCQDNLLAYSQIQFETVVVPPSKQLNMDNTDAGDRHSWGFDEATLSQLVWVYTEAVHKRNGNGRQFLQDFGKKESIRVASIDVGAGTTDIMVCDHAIASNHEVIKSKPHPVFWDSILRAGDDLLEEVIRRLIIKGTPDQPGLLALFMRDKSVTNYEDRLVNFFGRDHAVSSVEDHAYRRLLFSKLIKPLAQKMLEDANSFGETSYSTLDIMGESGDFDKSTWKYFQSTLGCDIREVQWKSDPILTNQLVLRFFEKQWKTISTIFQTCRPDVILLTGGVLKSEALERLMKRSAGIAVSRIHNLNNYIIGRWYPFVNERGELRHSKSTVSVGIAIADLAERNMLRGFQLDVRSLITAIRNDKLYVFKPGADGVLEQVMNAVDQNTTIQIAQIPARLSTSPVASPNYPKKNCYRMDFDREKIKEVEQRKNPGANGPEIDLAVKKRINELVQQAPFTMVLNRDEKNREHLMVEDVTIEEGQENANLFKLHFESLPDGVLWMDKGIQF